jgi:hypothetical protein
MVVGKAVVGMALGAWLPLVLAVIGGFIGWRLARTRRRWRSMFDDAPIGMSREEYERRRERGARLRRYSVILLLASLGASAGYLVLLSQTAR